MPGFRTPMRDPSQFASVFTQWVYDEVPHAMYFADVDGLTYAKARRCLRVFEWKYPGATLSPGQRAMLPLLDRMIAQGRRCGWLVADSGVYVIRGRPPFVDGAVIEQPWRVRRLTLSRQGLVALVSCQPVAGLWPADDGG